MLNQMTMGPLPAIFKTIQRGEAWCCGVTSCKGVVGDVREGTVRTGFDDDGNEMHQYGFYVELPPNYENKESPPQAAGYFKESVTFDVKAQLGGGCGFQSASTGCDVRIVMCGL